MTKRLYRSRENRMLAGVMGGLGEYFDVDPVIFRLAYVIVTIGTGVLPGILVYLLAVVIIPLRPQIIVSEPAAHDTERV